MTLNHHQLMIMMRYLIVSLQVLGSCLEPEQAHIDGFLHSMVFYIFDGPDDCHYRTVMWQTFEVFCSVSQSIGNRVLGSVMYPQDI